LRELRARLRENFCAAGEGERRKGQLEGVTQFGNQTASGERFKLEKKFVDTIDVLRAKGGRCLFDFEEQDLMKMEGVGGGMGMGLGASENVGCPTQ
jgi:hypothetical protein